MIANRATATTPTDRVLPRWVAFAALVIAVASGARSEGAITTRDSGHHDRREA
jgi:hypothetical protein